MYKIYRLFLVVTWDLNEAVCLRISPPHSHLHLTAWVQLAVQSGRYTEKENGAETKSSTLKPSLSGGKCGIKSDPTKFSNTVN